MPWLRHFALFVVFVTALFRPAAAGAFVSAPAAGSQDRVGAFELVAATLVGTASGVACGLHEGIGATYDENASGYRFAAEGLSNAEVRAWYAERVRILDTSGPLTRETAARVHGARNALKAEARAMMADRKVAAELARTQPLRSFESYVQKYSEQGFSGEALWQRIIQGGTTPNAAVNAAHGVR